MVARLEETYHEVVEGIPYAGDDPYHQGMEMVQDETWVPSCAVEGGQNAAWETEDAEGHVEIEVVDAEVS